MQFKIDAVIDHDKYCTVPKHNDTSFSFILSFSRRGNRGDTGNKWSRGGKQDWSIGGVDKWSTDKLSRGDLGPIGCK